MANRASYTLEDLLVLMTRLRDPDTGCPWDIKQSFESIVPYTLEEAYEVADAIAKQDYPHLMDELGDLLFQVIFYAQLGDEQQHFDFAGIVDHLVAKLVRRHPHVFPDGTLESCRDPRHEISDREISANWERIKQQEREAKTQRLVATNPAEALSDPFWLDDIPLSLPALKRAQKIQKRAAEVGFDWTELQPVLDKVHEEVNELDEAFASSEPEHVLEELGDLMFACVNLARHLGADAEALLSAASGKFQRRFTGIESELRTRGVTLDSASVSEMESLWNSIKQSEKRD